MADKKITEQIMEVRRPQFCVTVPLPNGAEGYVVIDTLFHGTSSGGLRVAPDLTIDEVAALADEMSMKYAFCGLPRGGAKSGLRLSDSGTDQNEKRELLREMGKHLKPFIDHGLYYPGMDMNCGPDDLRAFYHGAGINLNGTMTDSSFHTALTAESVLMAIWEIDDSHRPLTVAIEGFGSVATHLSRRMDPAIFKIIGVSTILGATTCKEGFENKELTSQRDLHGDGFVAHIGGEILAKKEDLLHLPVDILVPSARIYSLHRENAAGVKARYVVPISNAPYTPDALQTLCKQGSVCLSGFSTNCGGVLGSTLEDLGIPRDMVPAMIATYYHPCLVSLLSGAQKMGVSPFYLSTRIAMDRMRKRADNDIVKIESVIDKIKRKLIPVDTTRKNKMRIEEIKNSLFNLNVQIIKCADGKD